MQLTKFKPGQKIKLRELKEFSHSVTMDNYYCVIDFSKKNCRLIIERALLSNFGKEVDFVDYNFTKDFAIVRSENGIDFWVRTFLLKDPKSWSISYTKVSGG